jgi:nucleotidyltransferase AbiEii toxin of type IV toxin-antitoxin system
MNEFANTSAADRRDIFNEAAVRLGGVDFTIAEKDFWVCWTLGVLFELGAEHPNMVFKGGTSLSKAYDIISRFSEDIDIVTDVDYFLQRGAQDPEEDDISASERRRRIVRLDTACTKYVGGVLRPALQAIFDDRLRVRGWDLSVDSDEPHGHTLLFRYPWSDPSREHDYIRGRVKIELGWRSATAPAEERNVTPYAATYFPDLFTTRFVRCNVLTADRTFWEKVTALHAESFRDEMPRFFARHYSDVAVLSRSERGADAIKDLGMLETVRRYKQRYYPSAWARYDLAAPGTLRLRPSTAKSRALAADYRAMRTMFFSEPWPFSEVLDRLGEIEETINRAAPAERS